MDNKKSKKRLRAALRYVMHHPDLDGQTIAKEWKMNLNDALLISSHHVIYYLNNADTIDLHKLEQEGFEKLISLK